MPKMNIQPIFLRWVGGSMWVGLSGTEGVGETRYKGLHERQESCIRVKFSLCNCFPQLGLGCAALAYLGCVCTHGVVVQSQS